MKKGKYNPKNILKLRKSLDLTQSEIAGALGCDIKTYRDYEKGKQVPGSGLLLEMYNYYRGQGQPVSIDYILGLSDFTTPENDYIGKVTGLSDAAIEELKDIKRSDSISVENEQPGLCVLPVLNAFIGCKYHGFGYLLCALRDFLNTDYCMPVYHTGKGAIRKTKKGNTLYPETVTSQSEYDIIKPLHGKGQPVYLQHFARDNNPYDNKPVAITSDFLQAVALKQVESSLLKMKKDITDTDTEQ